MFQLKLSVQMQRNNYDEVESKLHAMQITGMEQSICVNWCCLAFFVLYLSEGENTCSFACLLAYLNSFICIPYTMPNSSGI